MASEPFFLERWLRWAPYARTFRSFDRFWRLHSPPRPSVVDTLAARLRTGLPSAPSDYPPAPGRFGLPFAAEGPHAPQNRCFRSWVEEGREAIADRRRIFQVALIDPSAEVETYPPESPAVAARLARTNGSVRPESAEKLLRLLGLRGNRKLSRSRNRGQFWKFLRWNAPQPSRTLVPNQLQKVPRRTKALRYQIFETLRHLPERSSAVAVLASAEHVKGRSLEFFQLPSLGSGGENSSRTLYSAPWRPQPAVSSYTYPEQPQTPTNDPNPRSDRCNLIDSKPELATPVVKFQVLHAVTASTTGNEHRNVAPRRYRAAVVLAVVPLSREPVGGKFGDFSSSR